MSDSKFYALFSASKNEIAGYHKFLRQTRRNREDLLRLLDHIRKAFRKPNPEKELDIEYCCLVIYGEETEANHKSILNMMSELNLMLKEYLLSERIKKNSWEAQSLWLSILSEKGLEKEFSKQALMDIRKYEAKPKGSISDYLSLFILQHQYYYYFTNISAVDGIIQIQKNVDALNLYVQVLKLRMLCETFHLKNMLPPELPFNKLVESLNITNDNISPNHVLPTLYAELRMLFETNDFRRFDTVTEIISKNAHIIGPKELDEFMLYLNSYVSVISRTNQATEGLDRIYRFNKKALDEKVFFHQGKMRLAHYLNILTVACIMKDFKWALRFAGKCKDLLSESNRQDAFTLSQAIIDFEKRDYNSLFKLLKGIEATDIYIQIRLKAFMVVCHYELKNTGGELVDYCKSLEAYLKRNLKIKPYKEAATSVLNMVGIVRTLQSPEASKQKVIEQINSTGLLVFRAWLLEKAEKKRR